MLSGVSAPEQAAGTGTVDERRRVRARLGPWTAVIVTAAVLLTTVLHNVVVESHRVLGWAIAATVIAVILAPAMTFVSRAVPRPVAMLVLGVLIAAVAGLLVYGVFDDLDTEASRLSEEGMAAAQELEARDDRWGDLARDLRLADRADAFFSELDDRIGTGGEALRSAAGSVPTYFVCWILTMFLLLWGGRITAGAVGLLRDEARRARMHEVLETAASSARGYILAALAQGVVVGSLTGGVALALDLPVPVLAALLVGTVSLLPYIGIVIGSLPVALLAAGIHEPLTGLGVFCGAVALQLVEIVLIRPRIDERTLHVGPAVPVIVAALGYEVYGIGGALYGTAIAVFLLALADAAARPEEADLPTPIEQPDLDEDDGEEEAAGGSPAVDAATSGS